jgi:hypothetical protein
MFVTVHCTDHSEVASSPRWPQLQSEHRRDETASNCTTTSTRLHDLFCAQSHDELLERRFIKPVPLAPTDQHHSKQITPLTQLLSLGTSDKPYQHLPLCRHICLERTEAQAIMASENQDAQLSASQASGADIDNETLSPLEQEVLDEYARLLGNLNNVRLDAPPVLHSPDSYLLSL